MLYRETILAGGRLKKCLFQGEGKRIKKKDNEGSFGCFFDREGGDSRGD